MVNISKTTTKKIPTDIGRRFKLPLLKQGFVTQLAKIPEPKKKLKFLYYKEEMSIFIFFLCITAGFGIILPIFLPTLITWIFLSILSLATIAFIAIYSHQNFTIYLEKDPKIVKQRQNILNEAGQSLIQQIENNYNIKILKNDKNFYNFGYLMTNIDVKTMHFNDKKENSYILHQENNEFFLLEEKTKQPVLPIYSWIKPTSFQNNKKQKLSTKWDIILENILQLEKMKLTNEQQHRCDRVLNSLTEIKDVVKELENIGQLKSQQIELEETLSQLVAETTKIKKEHHASLTQKITVHRNWLEDTFSEGIRIK